MQETQETWVRFLGWEDPSEEGTATHSNILAWKIPVTEGPGGLQLKVSPIVGHNLSNVVCINEKDDLSDYTQKISANARMKDSLQE